MIENFTNLIKLRFLLMKFPVGDKIGKKEYL